MYSLFLQRKYISWMSEEFHCPDRMLTVRFNRVIFLLPLYSTYSPLHNQLLMMALSSFVFLNKRPNVSTASLLSILMKSLFCNNTWWQRHLHWPLFLVTHSISLFFLPNPWVIIRHYSSLSKKKECASLQMQPQKGRMMKKHESLISHWGHGK